MSHPIRRPRLRSLTARALALVLVSLGTLIAGAVPAHADTAPVPTTFAGSASFTGLSVADTLDGVVASITVTPTMTWSQAAAANVIYDPSRVRQGRDLDPDVDYHRTAPGSMSLALEIEGEIGFEGLTIPVGISPTAAGSCDLRASGADYQCTLQTPAIEIVPVVLAGPYVDLRVSNTVTVTPEGIDTLREARAADVALGTRALELLEDPINDPLSIACSTAPGDVLYYELGDFATSPDVTVSSVLEIPVGFGITSPIPPFDTIKGEIASPDFALGSDSATIAMSAGGGTANLGAIQANNIPPSITSLTAPASGAEGSSLAFSVVATGPCVDADTTYRWSFSDGGVAYGPSPHHTFDQDGPYSGTVTVTDSTGMTRSRDFGGTITNVAPALAVLPDDASIAWGRPLLLEAQATDESEADERRLTYAWDFGDGDTDSDGGPTETHTWATPGAFEVDVEVCDDDICTTDTVSVTVRARTTTASYTGTNDGVYSAPTTLNASLVDEFGNPVNGQTIDFEIDGASVGTASTGAGGAAARSYVPGNAGDYDVQALYDGSPLYEASSSAVENLRIEQMATTLTYTGALKGAPNKNVTLSARLVDALGRPLVGQAVDFTAGSQAVSAVTGVGGVASTTLKLSQKPGFYALTAEFDGVADQYDPDLTTLSFNLNKK